MDPSFSNSGYRYDLEKDSSTATVKTLETVGAHASHTKWLGKKFEANGRVRPFPGNTIICHLPSDSALRRSLLAIYEKFQNSKFAVFYTLLPPPSWHMTVFEGVCDQIRGPDSWPEDLSLDAPLASCNALFEQKLAGFNICTQSSLRMAVLGLELSEGGIHLHLAPINAAQEQRLRRLRDSLSELLQLRHPGHDTYVFHLAIAYRILPLSQDQEESLSALLQGYFLDIPRVLELGVPEFCYFDDMFAFRRQFFLKTQS
ncbi:hypothetical protein B7463_g11993, partial [Scytalidium lignicola]